MRCDLRWNYSLFLITLNLFGLAQAPSSNSTLSASRRDAVGVPFVRDLVEVRVNGSKALHFAVDTGAGINVINTRLIEEARLKSPAQIRSGAIGGTVSGSVFQNNVLAVSGVEVSSQPMAAFSFAKGFPCASKELEGLLGYDFIKQFVVELDYANHRISLHEPKAYKYTGPAEAIPIEFHGHEPFVSLRVKVPGRPPITGRFELDTGSSGTLDISSPFARENKLANGTRTLDAAGTGVGGAQKYSKIRLESVSIGRFELARPVVSLALGTRGELGSKANAGTIGTGILRRFKVIVDYSRGQMMLEPNGRLLDPFEANMSGMILDFAGTDCQFVKVLAITPGTPAANAGIVVGDLITSIDGIPAARIEDQELSEIFKVEGAKKVLTVHREDGEHTITLQLVRLL